MNVSVQYRTRQRLQSATRAILGDGLLERARSTSLALLGLTAAVGLVMVAMALNQSWPLIAGVPIPGLGDKHQAVGDATVVAEAGVPSEQVVALHRGIAPREGAEASKRPTRKGAGGTTVAPPQPGSESIVVSRSTPVGDSAPDATPSPSPANQQPAVAPAPAAAPAAPAPAVSSPDQSPATSVTPPPSQTPVPSTVTPPPESPEEVDDDNDDDDDYSSEDGWDDGDDHSHDWHRGHGRGRHW